MPQGDSQSTQLFCLGINKVIENLGNESLNNGKYLLTVYLDDFIIAHN